MGDAVQTGDAAGGDAAGGDAAGGVDGHVVDADHRVEDTTNESLGDGGLLVLVEGPRLYRLIERHLDHELISADPSPLGWATVRACTGAPPKRTTRIRTPCP